MIRGHCHCGNISLEIPRLTTTATECNCSICRRYGALWGYFTQPEVKVIDQGRVLNSMYGVINVLSFSAVKDAAASPITRRLRARAASALLSTIGCLMPWSNRP